MKFTKVIKADYYGDILDISHYQHELSGKLYDLDKTLMHIDEEKMDDATFDRFENDVTECLSTLQNMLGTITSFNTKFKDYL